MLNFGVILAFIALTACGVKSYKNTQPDEVTKRDIHLSIDTDLNELYAYHVLSKNYNDLGDAQKAIIARNFANRKLNAIRNRLLSHDSKTIEKSLLTFSEKSNLHKDVIKEFGKDFKITFRELSPVTKSIADAFLEIKTENKKFQIFIANIEHTALITRN